MTSRISRSVGLCTNKSNKVYITRHFCDLGLDHGDRGFPNPIDEANVNIWYETILKAVDAELRCVNQTTKFA